MKKLLSVFAAVAMLFGFASCSGDLHDEVAPDNLWIIGALESSTWDKTEAMTTVSTGIYEITTDFQANAEFKFILVADKGDGSWNLAQDQYGSDGFSSKGAAKNFALENKEAGKFKVTYNAMTGVLTSESKKVVPSVTIKLGAANGFKDGTEVKITGVGSDGLKLDGSLFSWCGGGPVTLTGDGPDYVIDGTCNAYPDWVKNQNLYQNVNEGDGKGKGLPKGTDVVAKLKIGAEGWICFKNGESYTFDWNNLKK